MWNIREIIINKNIILERLKYCSDEEEKQMLEASLINNIILLEKSGKISSKLYKLIDKITTPSFYAMDEYDRVFTTKIHMDDEYYSFLLELCNNVASTKRVSLDEYDIDYIKFNEAKIKMVAKSFFRQLDEELYNKSKIIINDPSSMEFFIEKKKGKEDSYGLTINDYASNKCYIKVSIHDFIIDYQVFEHEVTHGIDFYLGKRNLHKTYPGFIEVPTYTVDHLFINYLEEFGFNQNQVQFLRVIKDNYAQTLAEEIQEEIKKDIKKTSFENVNYSLLRQLHELESCVIAYGLYKQIIYDKEYGINNLKSFMKREIPLNEKPDFTFIGLSDNKLLELSKEIGTFSSSYNEPKKIKVM